MTARPRGELFALTRLSLPIVVSLVAQNLMGVVDTLMVGPLGARAVASVGLGTSCFMGICFPIACILLGVDAEVSQAMGAGDTRRAQSAFAQSLYLAVCASLLAAPLVALGAWALPSLGVKPDLAAGASRYLLPLSASAPAFILHYAATRFLQAQSRPLPVMLVALFGNLLNAALTRWLAFNLHLGIVGAALATLVSRYVMAAVLLYAAWPRSTGRAFDPHLFFRLLRLGAPAALQVAAEVGIFVLCGVVVGRFDDAWMAAHHLVLQMASFTFMFPLGVAQAAAVRVGEAVGAGDAHLAKKRGWVAVSAAALLMCCFSLALMLLGPALAQFVVGDAVVTTHVAALVRFAAAFQLFDGLQTTVTGALRGLGDTKTPFVVNLTAYWFIAVPVGWYLAFQRGLGPEGLWCALAIGLVLVGSTLLVVWARRGGVLAT